MTPLELADACEKATGSSNKLDVLIEVALFKPAGRWRSVRANSAGTKVIYTDTRGRDWTYWAGDYTMSAERRSAAAAALRAGRQG